MLATLDKDDWEAISAIGTWFGVLITFLAVLVALFGEQLRRWMMRPKLSISCGKSGLLFQEDFYTANEDTFNVRLSVSNLGMESARNVRCLLASKSTFLDGGFRQDEELLPLYMKWITENSRELEMLPPESSSLLELGKFYGLNPNCDVHLQLLPNCALRPLPIGRHEIELILTSSDHLHYHGFFEISCGSRDEGKPSEIFIIKESRRITSDELPWWKF
jgi:hypothetical protein